jgi:hypothetical protein
VQQFLLCGLWYGKLISTRFRPKFGSSYCVSYFPHLHRNKDKVATSLSLPGEGTNFPVSGREVLAYGATSLSLPGRHKLSFGLNFTAAFRLIQWYSRVE